MNLKEPKSLTIEDLLKLKRLERPSGEFWTQFERELRAKQLAAIVDRRPWWHRLSRAGAFISRQHAPIGAVAVLAITWVTFQQFDSVPARSVASLQLGPRSTAGAVRTQTGLISRSRAVVNGDNLTVESANGESANVESGKGGSGSDEAGFAYAGRGAVETAAIEGTALPRADTESAALTDESSEATTIQPLVAGSGSHLTSAPMVSMASASAAPSHPLSASTPATAAGSDEWFSSSTSTSARLLAANLGSVRDANSNLEGAHRFFAANQDFAATASSATVVNVSASRRLVDPMTRMNPVSEERRARLLSSSLPAASGFEAVPAGSADRAESRLSSDRLYDSISRYGVDGHSFSIKF